MEDRTDAVEAANDGPPSSLGGVTSTVAEAAVPRRPLGAPPWRGGVSIGLFYAAALVLITYTLLPLPGQRAFGAGNYRLAGGLFAANLVAGRHYRRLMIRAARAGSGR
jgi:hypothetical protein